MLVAVVADSCTLLKHCVHPRCATSRHNMPKVYNSANELQILKRDGDKEEKPAARCNKFDSFSKFNMTLLQVLCLKVLKLQVLAII